MVDFRKLGVYAFTSLADAELLLMGTRILTAIYKRSDGAAPRTDWSENVPEGLVHHA